MRPLNECQDELIDGQKYTVWLIGSWDDYQLTDGQAHTWRLTTGYLEAIGMFHNNLGTLYAPSEHIIVDV